MRNFKFKKIGSLIFTLFAVLVIIQPSALQAYQKDRSIQLNQATSNDSTWSIWISPDNEPGEPMIVTGTVYAPDGKTPLEGIKIHVYQTDAKGIYSADGNRANSRIQGDMVTNKNGKYQFSTIKPGSYPNSRVPSHVHYVVSGPGYAQQRFELRFVDDPYLSNRIVEREQRKGKFGAIQKLVKDEDGFLRCTFDLKLEK